MATITTSGAARKARGQGGERREEILDHAQRLFAAHGVQSVSTRRIAEAVGVSQPTLYAYFPARSDLLDEVCARAFAQLAAQAAAARSLPGDRVEAAIRAYVRFGLENPDAYRIAFMLEGLHSDSDDDEAAAEANGKPGGLAFDQLRQVMAERLGWDHPDLEAASQSLWAAMHGLVSLFLARSGFPFIARDRLIDWHVAALMKGLPPPGETAMTTPAAASASDDDMTVSVFPSNAFMLAFASFFDAPPVT